MDIGTVLDWLGRLGENAHVPPTLLSMLRVFRKITSKRVEVTFKLVDAQRRERTHG